MSLATAVDPGANEPVARRSRIGPSLHVLMWASTVIYVPVLLGAYRLGHLRLVARGDGDQMLGAALGTCFLALLHLALHALTTRAFGNAQVPGSVRTARRLVVVGTWLVLIAAGVFVAQLGSGCFRTCAPFPQ